MSIFNIAWKLIFSKKQFSYTTLSIFISLIVSILSIATSITILGVSRNYENSVKKSISSIEPQITVNHAYNDLIHTSIIDSIIKDIYSNSIPYLAKLLLTDFMLAFELASVLLMAALIGGLYLIKGDDSDNE